VSDEPQVCSICGWELDDVWFVLVLPEGTTYYCDDCFGEETLPA
jgi:hypothetical protein